MSDRVRSAVIIGVSGQDGAYLTARLLKEGYRVLGTSRSSRNELAAKLERIGCTERPETAQLKPTSAADVAELLGKVRPNEIYFLSAQSSVGKSWDEPLDTIESIVLGTAIVLEAARTSSPESRLYFASSGDCFGNTSQGANEETPFSPTSPYAVARCAAADLVRLYREAHKLYACNGFTFAHESPLRPRQFVTQKIATTAALIAAGREQRLELGALTIVRDWGWAPEYVVGMHRMLQQPEPHDYVLATGRSVPLSLLVEEAFKYFDRDWRDHLSSKQAMKRALDISESRADPSRAAQELHWRAELSAEDVMRRMCEAAASMLT